MTDETEARRIYIGTFDSAVTHLTIPAPLLVRANDRLDAERAQRLAVANKARMEAMRAAKARGRLQGALTACFGGRWGR